MKFIIEGAALSRSLNSLMGLVAKNNAIPIVENFLFSLDGNTLTITASNLETVANMSIDLNTAAPDGVTKVCIPGKELFALVSQINDTIAFSINDEYSIDLTTNTGGKYNFKGINPEDYPQMIQIDDKNEFTIKSSTLVTGISKTIFATSTEEDIRPQMSGVLCEFSPKGLTFVGTDSHKLVRLRNVSYATEDERSFILPKKTLNLINRILSGINEDIDVKVENNLQNIAFYFANYHIACRLIEGKYPQYDAAIPVDNPNKLIVSKNKLFESIKRISIFANQTTNQIRFEITQKELTLQAEDVDAQNKAQEKMPCSYEGDDMVIGLNSKYLTEIINNVETENICFEMSRPDRPIIITPYDEESKDSQQVETLLMLVMPVILMN